MARGGRTSVIPKPEKQTWFDRLLTGNSAQVDDVDIELVRARPDNMIKHNLEYLPDIESMDFFMPLILLICIFALQIIYVFGYGTVLITLLQVTLWRDLFKRIRRRPSGRRFAGLCPPYQQSDWYWALGIYLVALPFVFGANWLNEEIFTALFPELAKILAPGDAMAGASDIPFSFLVLIFLLTLCQTVIFAPVTEELWFRGLGLTGFRKSGSRLRALLLTSIIFGALHGPLRILDASVMGLAFGFVRLRTGSLHCSIGVHALHNFWVTVYAFGSILLGG